MHKKITGLFALVLIAAPAFCGPVNAQAVLGQPQPLAGQAAGPDNTELNGQLDLRGLTGGVGNRDGAGASSSGGGFVLLPQSGFSGMNGGGALAAARGAAFSAANAGAGVRAFGGR